MDPLTQNFLQGNELQVITGSFTVGIRTKLLWLIGRWQLETRLIIWKKIIIIPKIIGAWDQWIWENCSFWPAFIIKHSLLLSCEFCCKNEKLFSIKISTRNDRFKDIWFQIDHLDRLIFFYSLPINSKSYIVTYVKSLYS